MQVSFTLATKGSGLISHGNMDVGTHLNQWVRWVVDPGNQSGYELNKIGFN
jgi:hypothetical protein